MSLDWCKDCGELKFANHGCPPRWNVWSPEYGYDEEDAKVIYAFSETSAAEKWAENFDRESCDYPIVGGGEADVFVRLVDVERADFLRLPTDVQRMWVTGESIPSYHATIRKKEP